MKTTNKNLKDRAIHGSRLAEMLLLKALVNSTPEVRDLLTSALSLKALCEKVAPEMSDDVPVNIDLEMLAVRVEKAEQMLIGMPAETLPVGTVS